ncbi:hypothetical protein [Paenibacillus pinistramenti]|nr:hypothetical protein [Paenibacillus pinistramenti]
MPHHKPKKLNNQQNKSSIMEEARETKTKKQADYPASLNGVPKL